MSTLFTVDGPHKVAVHRDKGGKFIGRDEAEEFWGEHPKLAVCRGCYVFAMRAGKGITPGYVGKATKTFKQGVFTPDKLTKYHKMLTMYARGAPVLFFLVHPPRKGKPNGRHIDQLEEFLIQCASRANDKLLNQQGKKQEKWGIKGVVRGQKGKPSERANTFRQMLKLGA